MADSVVGSRAVLIVCASGAWSTTVGAWLTVVVSISKRSSGIVGGDCGTYAVCGAVVFIAFITRVCADGCACVGGDGLSFDFYEW